MRRLRVEKSICLRVVFVCLRFLIRLEFFFEFFAMQGFQVISALLPRNNFNFKLNQPLSASGIELTTV